jgi:hypothetical protein
MNILRPFSKPFLSSVGGLALYCVIALMLGFSASASAHQERSA